MGYYSRSKYEQNIDICNNMDGFQNNYVEINSRPENLTNSMIPFK